MPAFVFSLFFPHVLWPILIDNFMNAFGQQCQACIPEFYVIICNQCYCVPLVEFQYLNGKPLGMQLLALALKIHKIKQAN